MVQLIPPPDHRKLLPPLVACLPTAFTSPRPPPALLPLLSPILRQRVNLLVNTSSPSESWLPLLGWKSAQAERLAAIVHGEAFELHPVSGEIDVGDVQEITYRRLDEETLHARLGLPDLELAVFYLWCEGDQEGGGDGWRVSEVTPLERVSDVEEKWSENIGDCLLETPEAGVSMPALQWSSNRMVGAADEDDEDYWARYDLTPGRIPGPSHLGPANTALDVSRRARATSEDEYYARYEEVQPEMESDDPSRDRKELGESSLNGNVVIPSSDQLPPFTGLNLSLPNTTLSSESKNDDSMINHLSGSSTSVASPTVSRLEQSAETISHGEMAIRQHVSTTIKSLFRLSRVAGISRQEFDELVRTELDTLSLLEDDE